MVSKPWALNLYFKSRCKSPRSRESLVFLGSRDSDNPESRSRESESDTQATDYQALLSRTFDVVCEYKMANFFFDTCVTLLLKTSV